MTMPRETGAEKAQANCPVCGGLVGVIETVYGSTAPAPCPKCYPATAPREQASAPSPAPVPRETGTAVAANEGSQGGEG